MDRLSEELRNVTSRKTTLFVRRGLSWNTSGLFCLHPNWKKQSPRATSSLALTWGNGLFIVKWPSDTTRSSHSSNESASPTCGFEVLTNPKHRHHSNFRLLFHKFLKANTHIPRLSNLGNSAVFWQILIFPAEFVNSCALFSGRRLWTSCTRLILNRIELHAFS